MAFPWIASSGLEKGTITNSLSSAGTTSSGTLIDVPHYTELARQGMAPYRGSYCARIRLAGGTTSQFILESSAFDDLIASTTRFVRLYFYLGKDLVMADADKFSLFEAESTLNTTTEAAFGIDRSSGNIRFWFAETSAATAQTMVLGTTTTALGKWYCAELKIVLDSGAGNDGTLDAYINDVAVGSQITALDQAAIVNAKIGVIGPDAGTSGTILIDDIIYDDTQVYADRTRFPALNRSVRFNGDHPLVGPGRFSIAFTDTTALGTCTVYDSDAVPNQLEPVSILKNVSASDVVPGHDIFEVRNGAYLVLTGVAPEAIVSIDRGGINNDGGYVTRGLARTPPRA